jgi:hypothetical protein
LSRRADFTGRMKGIGAMNEDGERKCHFREHIKEKNLSNDHQELSTYGVCTRHLEANLEVSGVVRPGLMAD